MSMIRHTPAPWMADGAMIESVATKVPVTVAWVPGPSDAGEVTEEVAWANRRLICAAPELYRRLSALMQKIDLERRLEHSDLAPIRKLLAEIEG